MSRCGKKVEPNQTALRPDRRISLGLLPVIARKRPRTREKNRDTQNPTTTPVTLLAKSFSSILALGWA
jgi:hypothetical protein